MGGELHHRAAREGVVLDTSRILLLRRSLGDQRTREVVEEVVFHLSDRLALLQDALEDGRVSEAQALAARLSALSDQVGLATFARVARALAACLGAGDAVAAAAVAARLGRLAEDALFHVVDYADRSAL